MQQNVVLQRVQADYQVGPEHRSLKQLLLEARDLLVFLVHNLGPASSENLLPVGDAPRYPALEQVVRIGELGGADNGRVLALARAYEEHDASASRDFLDHLGGAAEMRCGGLERDDVDALAYTVDIAGICGIPERCGMALVCFRCKQELEGDVGDRRRVTEEGVRLVVGSDFGAQVLGELLYVVSEVRLPERVACSLCCW